MSCSLGTAKMPIVLDQPEIDSNSGSQGNFNLLDLVDKPRENDRILDGSFNSVLINERLKDIHVNMNGYADSTADKQVVSSSTREVMEENAKKESSFKYLPNVFQTNDKIGHFEYDAVSSVAIRSSDQSEVSNETTKIINKKYKRKSKSKECDDLPLVVNGNMQINVVQNENIAQQIFVMKPLKSKSNKTKRARTKNTEKVNGSKKGYKLIAPYPTLSDDQLILLQKSIQKPPSCSFPPNVNPILIVKIEDEQMRLNEESKISRLHDYCMEYQAEKKAEENLLQNSLLNELDTYSKDKGHHSKGKKNEEGKAKCYKCYNCPFTTLSKDTLNYHIQDKEKCYVSNELLRCPSCKNIFYSATPLRVHLAYDHKMAQKEIKVLMQNIHEANLEADIDRQKTSCAYESGQLLLGGSFSSAMAGLEMPLQNIPSREELAKGGYHELPTNRHRGLDSCVSKRQTMLESYLDDIGKSNCSLPPPLTQNGSDLLENTFNFTAPVSEQLPSIQPPPAHSSSNTLDPPQMMVNNENHGFLGMANVFPDGRDEGQFKNSENNHYGEGTLMMTNEGYLPSQVHDIPVIHLDENNIVKPSNMLAHDINIDDFSAYQGNESGVLDDAEDDVDDVNGSRLSADDEAQEEKKKLKKLGVGFRCDINGCKVRLQSEKNIQYHRRCHEGTLYNCPECCKDCSTWISLSSHLWQAHKIDMELYKCDQCPYKTPSYSRLTNIHRGIHGKARPFLCDICGKGFKTVKQMRNHKNIHKAKMVRMSVCHCEICGRSVADKRQLELHINNTHKKKKPFLCYMCGYASAVKHSLVVHMRRHTGEKPYKCEKCEYKTADHNALRRHKMKHSGVRNYKCGHCSYTCIQASTYKVHIKTKHPGLEADIIFSCGQCSFQTLNRGSFLSHTSEHENYSGAIRKQARYHAVNPDVTNQGQFYTDSNRMDMVEPMISERVVETIVDLSGAQSLLEDEYYEVEKITGDLEDAQELKYKNSVIT